MNKTLRQRLADLLSRKWYTVEQLARDVDEPVSRVVDHLPHVRKSNADSFIMVPPECDNCGFSFSNRDRISRPSRCPDCRQERISGPWFRIET